MKRNLKMNWVVYSKKKQLTLFFLFVSIVICSTMGCFREPRISQFDINSVKSYRDIPFITNAEIVLIEELKAKRESFSVGQLLGTKESLVFISPLGDTSGFKIMLCNLLSDLFGITFIPFSYDWEALRRGLREQTIDFVAELVPTTYRVRRRYFMTYPIAQRSLGVYISRNSPVQIRDEYSLNNLRVGFLEDTTALQTILDTYPSLVFAAMEFRSFSALSNALMAGVVDAFIVDDIDYFEFKENDDIIVVRNIFPLAYIPISIATADPELQVIILALNKYIAAGGGKKIYEMYRASSFRYEKNELRRFFSDQEIAYLNNLRATNSRVNIALEHDNYPISFYNVNDNEFQGIVPDILAQISLLTDIEFNIVTDKNTTYSEMLEMLRRGEVSLISELFYTEARREYFLWGTEPYATSYYTLLSKLDSPNLEMFQVVQKTVGINRGSAYEYMYNILFPDNTNVILYNTLTEAQDALTRGRIDLLMSCNYGLLAMTNYREKTGYKINLSFSTLPKRSYFGFNRDEEILKSIFSKAQSFIPIRKIEEAWVTRVFDYSRKAANDRFLYMSIFSAAATVMLIVMIIFIVNNFQLQRKYKKQAATISGIFNTIPSSIFCKDLNLVYTDCNHSFEKFMRCNKQHIIGKTISDFDVISKKNANLFTLADKKVLEENITVISESWFPAPDNTLKLYEITKTPLIQKSEIIGVLGIMKDITEQKATQKAALQASKAKSSFLAHMSHEIRTPLNAIMGMVELIQRENISNKIYEYTQLAKQSGDNVMRIVNDILDFSKIEAGKLELMKTEFAIASFFNDVINIAKERIAKKPILFTTNIDCNIPYYVFGDIVRGKQILMNLISNAIKYTNEGFVTVNVAYDANGNTPVMLIDISDSGVGIKSENMEKLFTRFTRFDAGSAEGTGLGLVITKRLCEMLGGKISVKSEYGIGSTFSVALPIQFKQCKKLAEVTNCEEKRVLLYESRSVYAYSLSLTFDNLGVSYTPVSAKSEFDRTIENGEYPFIFIASFLYEFEKENLAQFELKSKIVLITELDDSNHYPENIRILRMPAYSLTIANVLNNVTNDSVMDKYDASQKVDEFFIAPSAKVLIVDDITTNLVVAEGLMSLYKMQIDTCKSGMESIEMVKKNKYDIVFMDHAMPGMDGIEATSRIRSLENPEESDYYKNLPIIALTANAVLGMREMFLQNDMSDFLSKPIEVSKLNSILKEWIPKEKQMVQDKSIAVEKEGIVDLVNIEIEGVDTQTGLAINGNNVETYFKVLDIFCKDILEKISEINDCIKENNIPLYSTLVHALKSASSNVGAKKVSELAKNLENAGKKGASQYILEHNEIFLAELKKLYQNIQNALISRRGEDSEISIDDLKFLKEKLSKLKSAIENMDAKEINNIISTIEEKGRNTKLNKMIDDISHSILLYEYDKVLEIIDSFDKSV